MVMMTGSNVTDACDKLYVDVGANIGQSLRWWYHSEDRGRGCTEFAKVATWQVRREYCADVFEAEPAQTSSPRSPLVLEVARHRQRGRNVRLYGATPFSLTGGPVVFNAIGAVNDGGGTISKTSEDSAAPDAKAGAITLQSMNAIEYLRNLKVTHLALKIDVEFYEYELLRGLIVSGALCVPHRRTSLLVEFHTPRFHGNNTWKHMFDARQYGLPELTSNSGLNTDAVATRDAMLWMLRSPACKNVTYIKWY